MIGCVVCVCARVCASRSLLYTINCTSIVIL